MVLATRIRDILQLPQAVGVCGQDIKYRSKKKVSELNIQVLGKLECYSSPAVLCHWFWY